MSDNHGTALARVPIRFHMRAIKIDWEIVLSDDGTLFEGGAQPGPVANVDLPDAWELVRRFLSLKTEDDKAVLDFLNAHGQFRSPIQKSRRLGPHHPKVVLDQIPRHAFSTIQEYLRRMLMTGNITLPTPWHGNRVEEYTIAFTRTRSGSQAEVLVDGVFPSMQATIQFKLLQGATFRTCARKDCRLPFEVTSRHKRQFCTQYCAHFTALRNRRKLQRKERDVIKPGSRTLPNGRVK